MEILLLTQSNVPIIGWLAKLLGVIMDWLFRMTSTMGMMNIGLCIILFTIIMNIFLLPITIKQQKSSKLTAYMQPELQAIQKKYNGRKDNESMLRMQNEMKAVYEKYGTSMMGGCSQLLIQMIILFALYQVIYRIPAYVPSVRKFYDAVATPIQSYLNTGGSTETFKEIASAAKMAVDKYDYINANTLVDFLYKLTPTQWNDLKIVFSDIDSSTANAVVTAIEQNAGTIESMNTFCGINLSTAPLNGFKPTIAWAIPILAGLSQWYSAKLMTANQPQIGDDSANQMAQQMNNMNKVMPIMSLIFCFTFACGIGIYWVASSVCRIVQQLFINSWLSKLDIDKMIEDNLAKANEKRAKKGLPPQKVDMKNIDSIKNAQMISDREEKQKEKSIENMKRIQDATEYYNTDAAAGSLASKANMVLKYNQRKEEARKNHSSKK